MQAAKRGGKKSKGARSADATGAAALDYSRVPEEHKRGAHGELSPKDREIIDRVRSRVNILCGGGGVRQEPSAARLDRSCML